MAITTDSLAHATGAVNALLHWELAAVETYTRALAACDDQELIAEMQKIRDAHSRAVRLLRDHVVLVGGLPANSSEPWSAFTRGACGSGPATTLAALLCGEEQGIGEYESALGNEDISPECRHLILTDVLPVCHEHVEQLNRLLGGMDH